MSDERIYQPQPGPQWEFLATPADIAIYGGAAGGGKSYALLLDAVRWHRVPGYSAVLFRREFADQTKAGGLWSESIDLYAEMGGKPNASDLQWRWSLPEGGRSVIQFKGLAQESDKLKWQGAQLAFLGFDELTHFTESQFWYLQSRLRSRCGVRPYLRATTNPEPDSWVRRLIDWWIDEHGYPRRDRAGALRWFVRKGDDLVWADTAEELIDPEHPKRLPRSLTFIPASLADNPALTSANPDYETTLYSLSAVEQAKLLRGNWNARTDGLAFDHHLRAVAVSAPPVPSGVRVLCVDPGGIRNPMGIVVLRVAADEQRRAHVEVIHSQRWWGPLVEVQGVILDIYRRFRCTELSIDNAHTLLVGQLEQLLGADKVSHPRGSESAVWEWYTTLRDMVAGGTVRIADDWQTLHEDLERARVVGTEVVLPEYETQMPASDTPRNAKIHCDELDALLRSVPMLARYTSRPTVPDTRPRAQPAADGHHPGRMATIAGHTRGRPRLR